MSLCLICINIIGVVSNIFTFAQERGGYFVLNHTVMVWNDLCIIDSSMRFSAEFIYE